MANNLKIFGVTYPNAKGIRGRSVNEGMQLEMMIVKEWLEHIERMI